VRFPAMRAQEFSDRVLPYGLLEDAEALAVFKHIASKNKSTQLTFNSKPRTNPTAVSPSGFVFGSNLFGSGRNAQCSVFGSVSPSAQCQQCGTPKASSFKSYATCISNWKCRSCGANNYS
jgi:hypothetical protein